ncbi:GL12701 [Drosophila persimilis]|uniref:GL12701 n=1 Tax=Drosophila persimilis TaxID=7234 RepID=B4GM34_DROPE|nr:GL12701 [Drosophila persimilis]
MLYLDKSALYIYSTYNKKKQHDKLQGLREQYARTQRLSDLIDVNLRQKRLKRLYRVIEDMREEMPTNEIVESPAPLKVRRRLLPMEPPAQYLRVRPDTKHIKEPSRCPSTESSRTLCYL